MYVEKVYCKRKRYNLMINIKIRIGLNVSLYLPVIDQNVKEYDTYSDSTVYRFPRASNSCHILTKKNNI